MSSGVENPPRATYEDLIALPEFQVGEIVDGELYACPRPSPRHSRSATALAFRLGPAFDEGRGGPGGWWLLLEPELHFAEDVVVPDLGGWHRERMPELPEEPFFSLPPDWVCEVVSPSTERLDRAKKLAVYARAGVAHLWLVNPQSRTLEAYRNDGGRWLLVATHAAAAVARMQPFDAIEFELSVLWGEAT